jgi:hypothetical protein
LIPLQSLFRTVPGVGIYFSSIHFMQNIAGCVFLFNQLS